MKLVQATIKYPPGKVFPSKYGKGDRQNIVVELPDRKQEIAGYIREQAKLFGYCYGQAKEVMATEGIDSEGIRAIATSLFIATQRKFSL